MPPNETNSGEDELIRLLLKRQSELNSLLELTRAINKNIATPVLIQMLEVICRNYLQIGKLRFLIAEGNNYICISKYGGTFEPTGELYKACKHLKKIKEPASLEGIVHPVLAKYDYFIPIYQKNKAIAYALIGDFNSPDDMVSNDLNFMQTIINVVLVALENKKLFKERLESERFQREMELAAEMQNMLIPVQSYTDDHIDLSARYLPHQNVGGDYFDFVQVNDHEYLWCIADVSGKGISAALLMANFQASLRAWVSVEDDLAAIVEKLNQIVLRNTKGEKFITLFIAIYNHETRKLTYVNAGHNPAILYLNGEATLLKAGTTIIGAFDELPFINPGEMQIEPGSLIFNYTDGLLDREIETAKIWNEDRLLSTVKKHGKLSAEKFNQAILHHVDHHVKAKPIDDITVLTLKFK
ncbi:PP2C family protein-serine/threonine phosphatase [Mucilaginibacter sp. JRF]|uniref:PP2C family protein-serine/threonine phosphatase n=1 Tax=Mucilaginibacter sp. JRF TaxID=2780088 RepID=UPI001880719F|nr:PP2C family protein-serine/threonine phosphatase [Mucilaginibacter sp. JRF]MBE9585692.1 PP2C family protein-serine/threonine phosphatase [Mucilaginibacter sp. JRF]